MKLNYAIIALLVFAAAMLVFPAAAGTGKFLNSTANILVPNSDVPVVGNILQFATPPSPVKANTNYYVVEILPGPPYYVEISSTPDGAPISGWVMKGYAASSFTVIGAVSPQQTAEFLNGGYYIYVPNNLLPAIGTKVTFVSPPKPLKSGTAYYVLGGFDRYISISATPNGVPVTWSIASTLYTTYTVPTTTTAVALTSTPSPTVTKIKTKLTRHH